MDIEFDMKVKDKNGKTLGTVDNIVNDAWTGEPRKYMVRRGEDALFFKPDQVASVGKSGVTLKLALDELEQTE